MAHRPAMFKQFVTVGK